MMEGYSLICCIMNFGSASKTLKVAQKYGIIEGIISIGRGTVSSSLLEFLGITDVRKEIVTMIVKSDSVKSAIQGIGKDMELDKPHHGIAFAYPVSEFIYGSKSSVSDSTSKEVSESMYKIIYVIVDKGRAEDVIEAANKGGARGGTIINARSGGIHEVQKLFSVEIEPQKEEVFIITKSETKDDIVNSIRTDLKLDEPGNGIIFILDATEAYGLHE